MKDAFVLAASGDQILLTLLVEGEGHICDVGAVTTILVTSRCFNRCRPLVEIDESEIVSPGQAHHIGGAADGVHIWAVHALLPDSLDAPTNATGVTGPYFVSLVDTTRSILLASSHVVEQQFVGLGLHQ